MNEIQRAKIILKILNKTYPSIKVPLKSRNVFTLLISVLLSAQCTDVNVNNVTKNIYPKFYKPRHFVKLGRKKIERLIKKIGIFRIKAKSIFNLSKILIEKYNGKVPKTFEELEKLPGVGHKTAGVVMSQGFGYPAFPIPRIFILSLFSFYRFLSFRIASGTNFTSYTITFSRFTKFSSIIYDLKVKFVPIFFWKKSL